MKIFFVVRGWPSAEKPQLGIFERDQALALKALGHEIVVLCVNVRYRPMLKRMGINYEQKDGIQIYSIFVHSFLFGKTLRHLSISLYEEIVGGVFLKLYDYVTNREGVPNVIYSHYLPFSAMALAAKRKYGIPVVGIEHWSELGFKIIKKDIRNWAKYTYPTLDRLLTVSTSLKNNILTNFGINSIVVNNMVSDDFVYSNKKTCGNVVRYVSVGNIVPRKGFDILIKAFNYSKLPKDKWCLVIVGAGAEYQKLRSMIGEYGLEDNIHLIGRKERKEVIETLQNSDVYVLSSYSETFGVSAIEALACGLPVIATECGGTDDYMNGDNGIVCPVGDVDKMSDAIKYMFVHFKEYDKQKISDDCSKYFSSRAIAHQLDNIFNEVIK